MKLTCLSTVVLLVSLAGVSEAQTQPMSRFDHVSLVTGGDVPTAIQWYLTHIGGKAGSRPDHVWYGQTWILIILANTPTFPTPPGMKATPKPSVGTALDHLAFSYPDIDAKVRELQAAGVKIVSRPRNVRGWYRTAFIEDPDGTSIELVEDKARLGFHHVHLHAPSPEGELTWIQNVFGGARTKIKGRDTLDYGEMKLIFEKDAKAVRSTGHVIDHLCFLLGNFDGVLSDVREKGTKISVGPIKYGNPLVSGDMAFFESPNGTNFEVLTRKPDYVPPK